MSHAELSLDPQTFRRLGYRVVDALAERMDGLRDEPVAAGASRAQMEALLREPPPREGADADEVLELALRTDNPRTTPADVEGTVARLGALAAGAAVV